MTREPAVPVTLAGAAAFLTLYATQPLLPLLARSFNASPLEVGMTVTAPTIAVALVAPAVGRFADRTGLRRVIVGAAFLLAATTAMAAASRSLFQLVAWRFATGLVTPGIFAGTIAYIHETWPASRSGQGTATYMTGTIVGGFCGRAMAGIIAAFANWHYSFAALSFVHVLIALALWRWLPAEPRRERHRSAGSSGGAQEVKRLLRNRQLVATDAIGFCVLFTNVAMFTYVTFHLAAPPFGLSTAALGWLFVVYLIGAVVTPYGGRVIDAYGHRTGMATAMAIGGAGALLTLAPWLPAIIAGLALSSTGVFIAQTTTSSYIGAVTTADRALAVGIYSTFYYTGGSLGGAIPSAFWHAGGWAACVGLVVTVQLIGVVVALTSWERKAAGEMVEEIEAVP